MRQSSSTVHTFCAIVAALCLALLLCPVASAQEPTRVLLVVRDMEQQPQRNIAFLTVDAVGQEQVYRTNAEGRVSFPITGTSIWLKAASDSTGASMEMDSNSPDGGMLFSLDGTDLALAFTAEEGYLFRVPFYMENPAFPELENLGPQESTALLFEQAEASLAGATPVAAPTGTATAGEVAAPGGSATSSEERGLPVTLLLLGGVALLVVVVLLLFFARRVMAFRRGTMGGGR